MMSDVICMCTGLQLCDVISKWETALREKGSGKFENTRVIQLTYKNRLYWRHSAKMETDRERLLLCYQVNQQVINSRFPLNRELALELSALMAQIDFGEYNSDKGRGSGGVGGNPHHHVLQALDKFYPYRYKDGLSPDELRELQEKLTDKWASLKGRSLLDCVRIYLTCTRKWPFFGATLFQARVRGPGEGGMVWLAVFEDSVTLLELDTMQPVAKYPYTSVVTFGGCQDDFMLVVSAEEGGGSQKLLFSLSKPKVCMIQCQVDSRELCWLRIKSVVGLVIGRSTSFGVSCLRTWALDKLADAVGLLVALFCPHGLLRMELWLLLLAAVLCRLR
ncbi:hypothetical protein PR048_028621 [Dryococelus australis]|uniref:FERM domain-containing protein n=1 Tax=Dryococelus australis TaxID=614101 RepID=A0ABQ9GBI6_9NEOP|nr:hypothetical protein PR048_028621 [Dryococelus australis]